MKGLLAVVLAVVLAYIAVSLFLWVLWNIWWLSISLAKLVVIAIVALPFYVIVRKRLLRG
jgi:RsiW-degrading membrane proteinase PrsW (M82 family)